MKEEKSNATGPTGVNMIEGSNSQISNLVQQEVTKYMNSINPNFINMVNMLDSSGINKWFAFNAFNFLNHETWIIDTGATNHMSGNIEFLMISINWIIHALSYYLMVRH